MKIVACAAALTVAFTLALSSPAAADHVRTPRVPTDIQVEAGHRAFLMGHAVGTQNYVCLPSGSAFAWTLFGPQATLFDDDARQIVTHFLSPNPEENGLPRATWLHSRDTSAVWAVMVKASTDPAYVAPGAIPWFLLHFVGHQEGPDGGDRLTGTTFIQRINTSGGVAPASGCSQATDVGKKALVPYTADYVFYRSKQNGEDNDD
jgi:hypothetical protein